MYLRHVAIRNIKCFEDFELSFLNADGSIRKWTTLLGQNGFGKSTLLQAIAVPLAGPGATRELLPVADGWARRGKPFGEIEAELGVTPGDQQMPRWPKKSPYRCKFVVTGQSSEQSPKEVVSTVPSVVEWVGRTGRPKEKEQLTRQLNRLKKTAWAERKHGWLACGYGPFRRLSGGHQDADRILYSGRRSAQFLTLFREDAALTNAESWLVGLHNTAREEDASSARALAQVKAAFANQFLPEHATLIVDARLARLQLTGRDPTLFQSLSDGYRSMLALGLDLLRWLIAAFPDSQDPATESGVVLIDELDAHLHPMWQQQIGEWLQTKFPNIQFIVATHSPFLAQVAREPQANVLLTEKAGHGVKARTDLSSVSTWRAEQIYAELFGLRSTRSPHAQGQLERLLKLEVRRRSARLSSEEKAELAQLSIQFPPGVEGVESQAAALRLHDAVAENASAIRELE